jgi:hypothetical protein
MIPQGVDHENYPDAILDDLLYYPMTNQLSNGEFIWRPADIEACIARLKSGYTMEFKCDPLFCNERSVAQILNIEGLYETIKVYVVGVSVKRVSATIRIHSISKDICNVIG